MAEEWGHVVVKAASEVLADFKAAENNDAGACVKRLAEITQIDGAQFGDADCRIGTVVVKGGYALFDFHCSDWSAISAAIVSKGTGIEYYFSGQDEYGTAEFFALNDAGNRFAYAFDQGGDAWDIEGYEDEVIGKLAEWSAQVPDTLKAAFPDFADTGELMFDGP